MRISVQNQHQKRRFDLRYYPRPEKDLQDFL